MKPGDTIEVGPGTYNGNVTVKGAIDIEGAQTNVNPNQLTRTNAANESIVVGTDSITGSNSTFNGFTVQSPSGHGIDDGSGVSNTTFFDNVVQDSDVGVVLSGERNAVVEANLIINSKDKGLSVSAATNDIIRGNVVQNSGLDGFESRRAAGLLSTTTRSKTARGPASRSTCRAGIPPPAIRSRAIVSASRYCSRTATRSS